LHLNKEEPMVIWFIGKSGAGKSEIGHRLYRKLKIRVPNVVYFDGDELRASISRDLGYSVADRYISEERRSRLCALLSQQGIHVICSALSNAPDIRSWNQQNIENYFEVYFNVARDVLYQRDSKGLYKKFKDGETTNVVGEDIPFHEPENPWLVIENNGDIDPDVIADDILNKLDQLEII